MAAITVSGRRDFFCFSCSMEHLDSNAAEKPTGASGKPYSFCFALFYHISPISPRGIPKCSQSRLFLSGPAD